MWIDIAKTVFIGASTAVMASSLIFVGNKFYKGVVLLIDLNEKYTHHEEKITSLVQATTIDIPNQIKNLNDDIIKVNEMTLTTFSEEFHPMHEDMKIVKKDIINLKKHTNYPENGY